MAVEILIMALFVVCTRTGVSNLLNRTSLAGRPMAAWCLARCDGTRLNLGRLKRCCYYYWHASHATVTPSCHNGTVLTSTSKAGAALLVLTAFPHVRCLSEVQVMHKK